MAPMQKLNYADLIARHPEVQQDRHGLSFSSQTTTSEIAGALSRFGVVMLLPQSFAELVRVRSSKS